MRALPCLPLAMALGLSVPALADEAPAADDGLFQRSQLTGDWGGTRSALEAQGIVLGADTIDEMLGNVSGGTRHDTIYEGRAELLVNIDLGTLAGWSNATFHANAYQIRGSGLSGKALDGNLMTASNIEAPHSFQLFDFWLEQLLLDGDLSLRLGQIAADDEFLTSQTASNFIDATFGWPAIASSSLPLGGPAYPQATRGVRVRYAASSSVNLAVGVFNGTPLDNATGVSARIAKSALLITELTYAVNQAADATSPPASYKLGAWYHTARFPDQRYDDTGQSLASPGSTGVPASHSGNYAVYLDIDQGLIQPSGAAPFGLSAFVRLVAEPPDRNGISFYGDVGIAATGLIQSRSADVLALGGAVAKIGGRARGLDQDVRQFSGLDTPIRDAESLLELTYRAQVFPWWNIQPVAEWIRHPRGGATPPGSSTGTVGDALVLGLRSSVLF